MVGRPSQRVGSCQDALTESQEDLSKGQEWSVDVHGGREWFRGHPKGSGVVGRQSHRARSGWEAIPDGREWSGGNPGGSGVVRRPFQRFGSGQEAILEGREWSCGGRMYGVYTLWLSCYFLYYITLLSFPVCMIIHLFLPILLRMHHVTAHNTLPFVLLLYCSVVTHIHIFPCIRIVIILLLHSDNAYHYIGDPASNG